MNTKKRKFSIRLIYDIQKLVLIQLVLMIFAMSAYSYYSFFSELRATERLIRGQLIANLTKMLDYGELLYLQPMIESTVKSSEGRFKVYVLLKKVSSPDALAYSGDRSVLSDIFKTETVSIHVAPYFGEVQINLTIGYSHQALNSVWILIIAIMILGIISYSLLWQIKKDISTQSFSIDELEQVIDNLDSSNEGVDALSKAKILISEYTKNKEKSSILESLAAQAKQVAHDIRSPLSALNMALYSIQQIPEERRILIRNSVGRINDIANQLLEKGKLASKEESVSKAIFVEPQTKETLMVSSVLDNLVSEKRVILKDNSNILLEANLQNAYGLFILASSTEIKRVISNLINNSVEAFGENKGEVEVGIDSIEKEVVITIRDNGRGIPSHILARLGEKGVTYGKAGTSSGSGLGVYHAKTTVESFGGKFRVESTVGQGTNIELIFPKAPQPDWFVSEINLSEKQTIVICDDDASIHGLWSGRLKSALSSNSTIKEIHFSSSESIIAWHKQELQVDSCLYLMDYELLNSPKNGLDIVEDLGIAKNSMLVTSRFEEPQIQARCKKLGVRLIPKGLASLVPIKIEKTKIQYDAILIDDDSLVHMTWNMMAKEKCKDIMCFENESLFQKAMSEIDQSTPVFIDMNLSQGVSGLDVAKRLHDLGFKNIHLATGYDADSIQKPDYIKSIVGKEFPLS